MFGSADAALRCGAAVRADLRHSGTVRIKTYGVDVPFMQLERHGWDIHIVSAEPDGAREPERAKGTGSPVTGRSRERMSTRRGAGHASHAG